MDMITIENDIKVFYVPAKSFPEHITAAHETLHSIVPLSIERKYFGISRPEGKNGVIAYKAAAEVIEIDHEKDYKLHTMSIKNGRYRCITVFNYTEDSSVIRKKFLELISFPDIDPDGYCIEWYFNEKDVKCLVRLKDDDDVKQL